MTHYRTIIPNGHGGGTTYRDHIVNPATREDAYAVAARIPGAYVESSPNGVTGWQDDTANPSPVPASAAIGVMPSAATVVAFGALAPNGPGTAMTRYARTPNPVPASADHAHTAAYSGPCMGECGV